jgi:hypothetical protein
MTNSQLILARNKILELESLLVAARLRASTAEASLDHYLRALTKIANNAVAAGQTHPEIAREAIRNTPRPHPR